jgi:predicted nucleotidyltransferase
MLLQDLVEKNLIKPPDWLPSNCHYLTIIGSVAYAAEDTNANSDLDLYGWCIPKKEIVFPQTIGVIKNFGWQGEEFEQWQKHHVFDQDALGGRGREYDFQVFNIVKYFSLLMENNPTVIDSLFTPRECVVHCTEVGNMVRDNRKLFLSKRCWAKYKGYAMSQLHKMAGHQRSGKRKQIQEKYGFDLKFGLHLVRLLYEAEMILTEGDLDLRRHNEHLKAIRRGEWTEKQIREWAAEKEFQLEKIYFTSELQKEPNEHAIKDLLVQCLEFHYGKLDTNVIAIPDRNYNILKQIKKILENSEI